MNCLGEIGDSGKAGKENSFIRTVYPVRPESSSAETQADPPPALLGLLWLESGGRARIRTADPLGVNEML